MEKRYPALRIIGTFYKTLGVLVFVSTILYGFVMLLFSPLDPDSTPRVLFFAVVLVIIGGALAVSCYAIGELVYVFLDLEENTRATNKLLRQQVDSSSS
jgi:hypothetical protein